MKKQTKLGLVIAAAAVLTVSVASLVSARGWVQDGADWHYVDNDGEYLTETMQSSGNAKFYLDEDGNMAKDYFLEDYNGSTYYFGANGAMVTNTWVAIEAGRVENQEDYIPDNYWYYFQASGKAMKGTSGSPKKSTIDGKKYLFNEFGQMCTGWVDDQGKVINPDDQENPFEDATYYCGGDNDGVLRAGWVTYYDGYSDAADFLMDKTNLYFYFNTTNNKKIGWDGATTKKINGKTYAFNQNGVMLSGWDEIEQYDGTFDSLAGKAVYFSGEDDGHQVKKGWVYAVPSTEIDTKAYGDGDEKYMYFNASGEIVYDQFKKINGKYYAFNKVGIMKTGLVIWDPNATGMSKSLNAPSTDQPHFKGTIDTDWANGSDVVKKGVWQTDSDAYILVDPQGWVIASGSGTTVTGYTGADGKKGANYWIRDKKYTYGSTTNNGVQLKLHNFGADGARKTGTNNVEFADDVYQINTTATGDKGSGVFSKKYYQYGVVLKANSDVKYGIYVATDSYQISAQKDIYKDCLDKGYYTVLTASGSKQKGNAAAKKDADGNYWLIEKGSDVLRGIWSVNVKSSKFNRFTLKYYYKNTEVNGFLNSAGYASLSDLASSGLGVYNERGQLLEITIADLVDGTIVDGAGNSGIQVTKGQKGFTDNNNINFVSLDLFSDVEALLYQSDYNGGSNKWIPFGIRNDARKTPQYAYDTSNPVIAAYQVKPNTDYFTNAYWE